MDLGEDSREPMRPMTIKQEPVISTSDTQDTSVLDDNRSASVSVKKESECCCYKYEDCVKEETYSVKEETDCIKKETYFLPESVPDGSDIDEENKYSLDISPYTELVTITELGDTLAKPTDNLEPTDIQSTSTPFNHLRASTEQSQADHWNVYSTGSLDTKKKQKKDSQHFEHIDYKRKHKCENGETFSCQKCGKHFKHASSLYHHKRICVDGKISTCEKCGNTFKSASALSQHKRACVYGETYMCEICATTFKSATSLNQHKRKCVYGETYSCEKCQKHFASKCSLKRHKYEQHTTDDINTSTTFNKLRASTQQSLADYLKVNSTGSLDTKKKQKKDSQHFEHIDYKRKHECENGKTFTCKKCGKSFKHSSSLCHHKRVCVYGEIFKCDKCHKHLANKRNLLRHKRTCVHGETLSCE